MALKILWPLTTMGVDVKIRVEKNKSESGFALLEAVAFLFIFIVLTVYTIDFFTAIHTGIVNSIAARTYLFETLQHRSDITLLRQGPPERDKNPSYVNEHYRFHAVVDEEQNPDDTDSNPSAGRTLTQADSTLPHEVNDLKFNSKKNKTASIYIKTGYGICIDAKCPVN